MRQSVNQRKQSGFTIIEVLIVLAIAGLIMLVVFLAVPALQRNQRNSSRKNDASRVASSVSDFVSNSSGNLPKTTNWGTDCTTLLTDAGTLDQFKTMTCGTSSATMTDGAFNITTGAVTLSNSGLSNGKDSMMLDLSAQCNGSNSTTGGTARQVALLYTVETGGTPNLACLNAQ